MNFPLQRGASSLLLLCFFILGPKGGTFHYPKVLAQEEPTPATGKSIEDLSQLEQPSPEPELLKEIQIVRLSSGMVKNPEGQLRFQVSSFSPILAVKVNGFAQMVLPGSDFMEYEVPYQLQPGKNRFLVFVQTRAVEIEKIIIISYTPVPLEIPVEPLPMDLLVIIGEIYSDNIKQAPEIMESGTRSASKNELLISLSYHLDLDDRKRASIKGLIKLDRQKDRSLASEETLFRQFSLEYSDRDFWDMEFSTGFVQNVIGDKIGTTNPNREGEFSTSSENLSIFCSFNKRFGKSASMNFKVEIEQQNSNTSDLEDGTLNLVELGGKADFWGMRWKTGLQSLATSLKEPTKNYRTSIFSFGNDITASSWIFGLRFRTSDQQYLEEDSGSRITPQHKQERVSLQSKFRFSRNTITDFSLTQIKQESNDATKTYVESQAALKLILSY